MNKLEYFETEYDMAQMNESCSTKKYDYTYVLDSPVYALSIKDFGQKIIRLAKENISSYVCVANVHMLIESYRDKDFNKILHKASLVTPDGMPLVWMLRALGNKNQERVSGLNLFHEVCSLTQEKGLNVALVGSEQKILDKIVNNLSIEYPDINLSIVKPLPFRDLTSIEFEELINEVNLSEANIVFISLGCPKQEKLMSKCHGKINAVMIGIGGVFPVYAGLLKITPLWLQSMGLEWLFRLLQEPKRLWKRYATTNFSFIFLALKQLSANVFLNKE